MCLQTYARTNSVQFANDHAGSCKLSRSELICKNVRPCTREQLEEFFGTLLSIDEASQISGPKGLAEQDGDFPRLCQHGLPPVLCHHIDASQKEKHLRSQACDGCAPVCGRRLDAKNVTESAIYCERLREVLIRLQE